MSGKSLSQEGQERALLLLAGGRDGQDAFGQAQASIAVRAEGTLAPEDGWAPGALGGVVGGLKVLDEEESPEGRLVGAQIGTERVGFGPGRELEPLAQEVGEGAAHGPHLSLEGGAIKVALFEAVPERKELRHHRQGLLPQAAVAAV